MEAEAVIKLIWGGAVEHKNTIALFLILLASIYRCIQEHGNIRVQKEQMKTQKALCDGNFKLHNQRITTAEKNSEDAKKESRTAIDAVKEIKPKVDDMHAWFEDKYKNAKAKA